MKTDYAAHAPRPHRGAGVYATDDQRATFGLLFCLHGGDPDRCTVGLLRRRAVTDTHVALCRAARAAVEQIGFFAAAEIIVDYYGGDLQAAERFWLPPGARDCAKPSPREMSDARQREDEALRDLRVLNYGPRRPCKETYARRRAERIAAGELLDRLRSDEYRHALVQRWDAFVSAYKKQLAGRTVTIPGLASGTPGDPRPYK